MKRIRCFRCRSIEPQPSTKACATCGQRLRVGPVVVTGNLAGNIVDVFQGRHERMGAMVVVKLLRHTATEAPEVCERFLTECLAMRRCGEAGHPGIAAFLEQGTDEGRAYLVEELVEGRPLAELLPGRGGDGLPWQHIVRLGVDILDALAPVHGSGVVHRDISPNNVILRERPVDRERRFEPVLIDFGMARVSGRVATIFAVGGTPHYVAPEQVLEADDDPRSDLFGVAAILYAMLSRGRLPYADAVGEVDGLARLMSAALRIRSGEARLAPLADLAPSVPAELAASIERGLAPRPEDRFASAVEMAAALRAFLPEAPSTKTQASLRLDPSSYPPPLASPTLPIAEELPTLPIRRSPARAAVATVGVVAVASAAWMVAARPTTGPARDAGATVAPFEGRRITQENAGPVVTPGPAVPVDAGAPPAPPVSAQARPAPTLHEVSRSAPDEARRASAFARFVPHAHARACYERSGLATPLAVRVRVVLEADGRVRSADPAGPMPAAMRECLARAFAAVRFPAPGGGGATFVQPYSFKRRTG